MSHACAPGCAHYCRQSPTKRHRYVMASRATPEAPGVCKYCCKRRRFTGGLKKGASAPVGPRDYGEA